MEEPEADETRWEGAVAGVLVLAGLILAAVALFQLAMAQWTFTSPAEVDREAEAMALRFAWLACVPFLAAALVLVRGGRRVTAAIVGGMALLSLVTVAFRDGLGFVLQVVAAGVAAVVAWKERTET